MKLLDILLLPARFYQNITGKKPYLYLGVLFVGLVDLFLPFLSLGSVGVFVNKTSGLLAFNIAFAVLLVLILGLIDVLFFTVPLFDLFKVFKKEKETVDGESIRIRLAKIYVLAHIITVPFNVIAYLLFPGLESSTNMFISQLVAYFLLLVWVWFCAIISRGINSVYSFSPIFKRLVFLTVFLWTLLSGTAISMLRNWLMLVFR